MALASLLLYNLVLPFFPSGSNSVDACGGGSFGLPLEQEGLVSFKLENPYPPL